LVPVTDFIESQKELDTEIEPYRVTMNSGAFALGGIWERWPNPTTKRLKTTFALITTPANNLIRPVAERMPLIISPSNYDRWLSRLEFNPHDLLVPFESETMRLQRASPPEFHKAKQRL
jgi:putative SOS response-associated peptidase YedK